MPRDRGQLQDTWRTFFREACPDDVRQLAADYPQDRSLYVDVMELYEFDGEFTKALFSAPDRFLGAGADALRGLADGFGRVNVRLTNHPGLLGIDGLRSRHVSELVTVEGVAASVDGVQSAVVEAVFECPACGETVRRTPGNQLEVPRTCPACGSAGPLQLRQDRSRFVDVQRLELERPPDGRGDTDGVASIDAVLDDDLVGTVRPDERLLATGIVRLERTSPVNRFDLYLDAVSIDEEPGETQRTVDDVSSELARAIQSRWEVLTDR